MHLKTLTLKGFKSFADTTALDLEPGVTVVVGPNGSGKSNVVDAISWVLGAQAPSSVRSSKMDDVIFAGTDKRSALGRAEVSLTIDGVLISKNAGDDCAIVNGDVYSRGDALAGLVVESIAPDAIELRSDGVRLRVPVADRPVRLRLPR